jgi:hypothetical protein
VKPLAFRGISDVRLAVWSLNTPEDYHGQIAIQPNPLLTLEMPSRPLFAHQTFREKSLVPRLSRRYI